MNGVRGDAGRAQPQSIVRKHLSTSNESTHWKSSITDTTHKPHFVCWIEIYLNRLIELQNWCKTVQSFFDCNRLLHQMRASHTFLHFFTRWIISGGCVRAPAITACFSLYSHTKIGQKYNIKSLFRRLINVPIIYLWRWHFQCDSLGCAILNRQETRRTCEAQPRFQWSVLKFAMLIKNPQ